MSTTTESELDLLREQLRVKSELAETRAERIALLERKIEAAGGTYGAISARDAEIAELQRQLGELSLRLEQIQASLPVRAWERAKRVPPLNLIAKRRARRYWAELEARRG